MFTRVLFAVVLTGWMGCSTSGDRVPSWERQQARKELKAQKINHSMKRARKHWRKRDHLASLDQAMKLLTEVAQSRVRVSQSIRTSQPAPLKHKPSETQKKVHEQREAFAELSEIEQLGKIRSHQYDAMMLLSRAHFLKGEFFEQDLGMQEKHYEHGATWGERALSLNESFKTIMGQKGYASGAKLDEALRQVRREEVDALYWTAVNLAKWTDIKGIDIRLKYKPLIWKMMSRVGELDPDYYLGAIHRFWGIRLSRENYIAGGGLEKSYSSFQNAFQISGDFAGNYIDFAESYAIRKKDRALFEKSLEKALQKSTSVTSELLPEQRLYQKKAKQLLSRADELFISSEI